MTSTTAPFPVDTRFFTISTAGHVDHGKTSLIKALTGIDPDRLKEEKERQMTTDLGFAHLKLSDDSVVGFVDVPGHGKFLKNMLAGVGGLDMALLVVAADEGPMPQTRQHVRILSLLGVNRAVVALSKIDLVGDAEHREIVQLEIRDLLAAHGIEMLALVPVSSTKKVGLNELKGALKEALFSLPDRDTSGGAYLPVDRVFSKTGFGTVITGTVVRGRLKVGDQFTVGPNVTSGRVRRLETFGQPVNEAVPGQRVACNLALKDSKPLTRGHVIMGAELPATKMMVVSLVDRPQVAGDRFVQRLEEQPIRLYHGTAEHHGFIRWAKEASGFGDDSLSSTAIALLALDDPAVALAGDKFVIRLSDETIFGGKVLLREKPKWLKHGDLLSFANKILAEEIRPALLTYVAASPKGIIKAGQVELFLPPPLAEQLIASLIQEQELVLLGESLMATATRLELSTRLTDAMNKAVQLDAAEGREVESVMLEVVRTLMSPKLDRATYQILVEAEVANGKLVRKGDQLSFIASGVPKVTDAATSQLQEKLALVLEQNFCLELTEVAKLCAADLNKVKNVAQSMARAGQVVVISHEFVIASDNLKIAHRLLAEIWQNKRTIAPTDFREGLNTTRKYAMALLQYFDDAKITRRLESGRVLLRGPDKV